MLEIVTLKAEKAQDIQAAFEQVKRQRAIK